MFQPENGMPILSWYEDKEDTKLYELIPALKLLSQVNDVRPIILESTTKDNKFMIDKCIHLCERSIKEMQPTVPPPQMQYRQESNTSHEDSYNHQQRLETGGRITADDGPSINSNEHKQLKSLN
jgi:NLI interacting factor-like phosphatase